MLPIRDNDRRQLISWKEPALISAPDFLRAQRFALHFLHECKKERLACHAERLRKKPGEFPRRAFVLEVESKLIQCDRFNAILTNVLAAHHFFDHANDGNEDAAACSAAADALQDAAKVYSTNSSCNIGYVSTCRSSTAKAEKVEDEPTQAAANTAEHGAQDFPNGKMLQQSAGNVAAGRAANELNNER